MFGETLANHVRDPQLNEGALLQYVDDILIASKTKDTSDLNMVLASNFFWWNKAVKCLSKRHKVLSSLLNTWVLNSPKDRDLLPYRREALARVSVHTKRQLQGFLGIAGF